MEILRRCPGRTHQPGLPRTPAITVAACVITAYLLLAGTAAGAWVLASRRRAVPWDPLAVLGSGPALAALARPAAARRAVRLRQSLAGADPRALADGDIGLSLGRLMRPGGRGRDVFASWEDTLVAFMAPRSGKTTAQAIPFVLSAPVDAARTNTPSFWNSVITVLDSTPNSLASS